MIEQRELRGWLNTGMIAVMTLGWLVYAGWTALESHRTKQQLARFREEIARRAAPPERTWQLEVEDAPGAPNYP